METTPSSPSLPSPHNSWRTAAHFWERGRIVYNLVLTAVALFWVWHTWPHFRPVFNFRDLAALSVLALLANACYCAAYAVDLPLQYSSFATRWPRWRAGLWVAGTLFAAVFESYWILDEIYPGVG